MPSSSFLKKTLDFARGHQAFKNLYFKQHEKEFMRLVEEGQSPQALFISCSDSRIEPHLILNTKPGDLFVIRTAGNFIPPYDPASEDGISATIQYALEVLNVRHIIICGHSHCGAIQSLYKQEAAIEQTALSRWLKLGKKAKEMTLTTASIETNEKDLLTITSQISVIYQLQHLLTFPLVKERVEKEELDIHGWYYHLESGDLTYYNPELYQFTPLAYLNN